MFELNLMMFTEMSQKVFIWRLHPGADLKSSIMGLVNENHVEAGWIITCVGSLSQFHLRFANQREGKLETGHFEIVSLVGTVGKDGCHLHIGLSDESGFMLGGHVLEGCTIYTTAEMVIGITEEYSFTRELDKETGFKELKIISNEKARQ
jgi:predicted DNA-binding protein with PD1-like motif